MWCSLKQRAGGFLVGAGVCLLLAWPAAAGENGEKPEPKKPPAAGAAAPKGGDAKKAKKEAAEAPDPFVVPDGKAADLVKYIERLSHERPSADTPEAVTEYRRKMSHSLLEAADKLLAAKPNKEQRNAAIGYKLIALQMLDRMGDAKATRKLDDFPAEVAKLGIEDKDLVRAAQAARFGSRLRRAGAASRKDVAALLDELKKFLQAAPLDRQTASLALNAAMLPEGLGYQDLAIEAYRDFGKLLAASENEEIAALGSKLQGAARRLGLVGKPMSLEGVTVDGKKFKWDKYKGKVVLVDFWATWCGPCRAELVNIEKNYDAYHDRGFDVVGISVDEKREDLDDFLDEHKLPWTVLHDREEAGPEKSMAVYYGVFGIPTVILVGADGKVISTNARGEQLGKELKKLFGPPPAAKKDKAPEKAADGQR